ncbi:MAG: CcdB family protein [Acetobacteraceae bacterium]|nr:CcdB family protein [Pseudomonadota bacterium]
MTADQLSVHDNSGRNRRAFPFAVIAQSNRFRASTRRVVVPLLDAAEFRISDSDVDPHFVIGGCEVVLDLRQVTNIPLDLPGRSVASLAAEDVRVDNALDVLFSRAWR